MKFNQIFTGLLLATLLASTGSADPKIRMCRSQDNKKSLQAGLIALGAGVGTHVAAKKAMSRNSDFTPLVHTVGLVMDAGAVVMIGSGLKKDVPCESQDSATAVAATQVDLTPNKPLSDGPIGRSAAAIAKSMVEKPAKIESSK